MTGKFLFAILGQALLIQMALSNCIRREDWGCGCGSAGYRSGGLAINNGNYPMPLTPPPLPLGISVSADNLLIDGYLDVTGNLPFLGAVLVEAVVPSRGMAEGSFSCGDGYVGMMEAGQSASAPRYGPGLPAAGYNRFGRCGCA